MNVIGINHYFHDTSACAVVDGKLVVALEEERFTRDKHTTEFPARSARACMDVAGLAPEDVDHIAVSAEPAHRWDAKLRHAARAPRRSKSFLRSEIRRYWSRRRGLESWIASVWPDPRRRPTLHHVQHHLAHAAGSFLVSGFDRAALLGIDGSGEWATSLLGVGEGGRTEVFQQSWFPMSLGSFFEAVTDWCGFRPNYDEGKTMGLAPYGDPAPFYDRVAELVTVKPDGGIRLDLSYFDHQFHGRVRYAKKFVDTFGPPRTKHRDTPFDDHHLNVAAAFQQVLEDRVLEMCDILHRRTQADRLVIAGGVALNSVMNGRIVRESPFRELYVMPGAGDNGTSIGAAFYCHNTILDNRRVFVHDDPYIGNEYTSAEIRRALEACCLEIEHHDDIERVAAELLHRGRMIGWFQGRMEFGPRSLGNRSILANPTLTDSKAVLNARVKHREAFRPFAPSCPADVAATYFDTRVPTPFMLKVCPVREVYRDELPAITHVDGSARLQTVDRDVNPRYHELLTRFGDLSGVPVLLNTSFNIMGEPIVESPLQAIRCFFSTGLDELILGNYVVRKHGH